jgi:hypothetical protein
VFDVTELAITISLGNTLTYDQPGTPVFDIVNTCPVDPIGILTGAVLPSYCISPGWFDTILL